MDRIKGVNLSGWFIPEPWVTPSLFTATGASDADELLDALGPIKYVERMRHHLETFASEDDFRRMSNVGLNAVRLPVPWYWFGVQDEDSVHFPVVDYIDRAMEWTVKYDLKVLLDLATVPGGQGDANEQSTSDFTAEWHSSNSRRATALGALTSLAKRYGHAENLLGIELLDSPQMRVRRGLINTTEGIPGHYLRNFYRDAYDTIRPLLDDDKLIVFSSSGYPDQWKHFMSSAKYKNVVMDVHLYHYKDQLAQDITSPLGLTSAIARNKSVIKEARAAGFPVIVGEWSGAAVFANSSITPEGRSAYERVFVANQLASFEPALGWFFQTWKTEKRIPSWDARVTLATLERAMID